jgi:hypothetical protein
MKKLIVLFAILAMVNVASAGIVDIVIASKNGIPITPVKEITINPTDTLDLDIVYTPDEISLPGVMSISKIMTKTPGSGGTFDISSLTWPSGYWMLVGSMSKATLLGDGNVLIDAANASLGSAVGPIVLDHFLFHCDAIGTVTISLVETAESGAMESLEWANDYSTIHLDGGDGVIIHQGVVPEPMTLTILGLGSLFLARRKK